MNSDAYEFAGELEQRIVDHVVNTTFEDLPSDAIEGAKRTLLWFLMTTAAGSDALGSDRILSYAQSAGTSGEATVFGPGVTLGAEGAAFVNACFAKALEYEDKFWMNESRGYAIGFAIAASAVSVAEMLGDVSGRRLIEAIAVGVDVQARLLMALDPTKTGPNRMGWNTTYTLSNYGAAIAAGKLLGLDRDQLVDALGLAHAQVSGNFQSQMEGVLGIRMQAGFVVRNGLAAARLAKLGVTGARRSISGRYGLFELVYPHHDVDLHGVTADLGSDYLGARLGFKGYPCGVVAHPALDAVKKMREGINAGDVIAIRLFGRPSLTIMAEPVEQRRNPRNVIDAQFSIPWVLACMLRDGVLDSRHFQENTLDNAELRRLARCVTVIMDESHTVGSVVEFDLADGSSRRSDPVRAGRGHPDNPVPTESMLKEMHAAFSRFGINEDRIQAVADAVLALDECANVAAVLRLLRS